METSIFWMLMAAAGLSFIVISWFILISSAMAQAPYTAEEQAINYIKALPAEGKAHYDQAVMFLKDKKYEEALEELRLSAEKSPKNPVPYDLAGLIYRTIGKYKESLSAYGEVFRMDETFSQSHLGAALSFWNIEQIELAKQHVKRHLTLSPDSPYQEVATKILNGELPPRKDQN